MKLGVPKLLVELFLLILESKKADVPFRIDWKMLPFDSFRTGLFVELVNFVNFSKCVFLEIEKLKIFRVMVRI